MSKSVRPSNQLVLTGAKDAKVPHRASSEQIDHQAAIGRAAGENPDLPPGFVEDVFVGLGEAEAGELSKYQF